MESITNCPICGTLLITRNSGYFKDSYELFHKYCDASDHILYFYFNYEKLTYIVLNYKNLEFEWNFQINKLFLTTNTIDGFTMERCDWIDPNDIVSAFRKLKMMVIFQ